MTTFYIVRHGQTDWNLLRKIQGQLDIPLNVTGEKQAQELARKLDAINFDLAFSSDLMRAKRTTEIIGLENKLAVETTQLLRERHFGKLEGQPSEILFTHLKLLEKLSHQERLTYKIGDDIESDEELTTRVITFIRETAIAYPGKKILVGTHGGVLRMILTHIGYFTYKQSDSTRIANGGYIKLETDGVDFFVKEIHGARPLKS